MDQLKSGCPRDDLAAYDAAIPDRDDVKRRGAHVDDGKGNKEFSYFAFIRELVKNRTAWGRWMG